MEADPRADGLAGVETTQRFTPGWLARWLARGALAQATPGQPLRCLDPACGGGRLLLALYEALRARGVLVYVSSDFGRTAYNADDEGARGKDHWPVTSSMIIGLGAMRSQVGGGTAIGRTTPFINGVVDIRPTGNKRSSNCPSNQNTIRIDDFPTVSILIKVSRIFHDGPSFVMGYKTHPGKEVIRNFGPTVCKSLSFPLLG